jgi:hypothetical protein
MKLEGAASDFLTMATSLNYHSFIFTEDKFSYEDFYAASPIKECDLFKCEENGRIYMPTYNLLEYSGKLQGIDPVFYRKTKT